MLELRPYQADLIGKTRRALKHHRRVLMQLPTGGGKCLGKGTPVLMYDSRIKAVEDVRVGDLLMGPDSKPRRVLSTCSGSEMLYRVTPTKGDPYVVNESHILSLRMTQGSKGAGGRKDGEVVNIGVADYLGASNTFRHCAKGWRAAVDFSPGSRLAIDPYIMGLWLGDGDSKGCGICITDGEPIAAIHQYAETIGLHVREERAGHRAPVYFPTTGERGRAANPMKTQLRRMGLIHNKHIPADYKRASVEDRLALLAGLIDSDGHLSKNDCYDIVQKSERLADDLIFVARSLGFAAYKKSTQKRDQHGNGGTYWRCTISGGIERIPVKIPRKRSGARAQVKNVLNVGIKVEPIGEGEYFGFEIDGDRLFMLGDFTVTHNTVISATMMGNAAERGLRSWFVVHRRELVEQTSRTLERVGVPHGYIAAGFPPRYRELVTLCSVQTLRSRAERLIDQFGAPDLVVWDESHHCAAGTWGKVAALVPDAFHVGLTATPERLDGKGLDGMFRALVPGPSVRWLIDEGYLSKYRVWTHTPPDLSGVRTRGADYDARDLTAVMGDRFLLGDCVQHYLDICPGKQAVAFCVSVDHAIATRDAFRERGVVAEELDGSADMRHRREVITAFRAGKIQVLTSVDLFGEGFDLPELTAAILLRPTKSLGLHLQQVGRALRTAPGKEFAVILDHAGNIAEHGLPDEEREWSLHGRRKRGRKGSAPVKTCGNCFGTVAAAVTECPYCGTEFEGGPRDVEQVDGQLIEIDPAVFRRQQRREVGQAKTREELERIAAQRGYKKAWVDHIMRARETKVG